MTIFFPSFFARRSIILFFVLLLCTSIIFFQNLLSLQWILFGTIEVVGFFAFSHLFSKRWATISVSRYQKRLFWTSFIIRVIWVIFSYYYFLEMTGKPFEYYAADSAGYHGEAVWLVELLKQNKWFVYVAYINQEYSDMGYPLYLGIFYYFFGSHVLLPRLIKALIDSFTCLLVYKIGRNSFGESIGRVAGILSMLVPNLIYYCGLHAKETEMVFLTVGFVYLADKVIRARSIKLSDIIWLLLLGASLFFFRTVLAVCLIGSLTLATVFTSNRLNITYKRVALASLLVIGGYLILTTPLSESIGKYVKGSSSNVQEQMDNFSSRKQGNKFAKYGSRSIFLPLMLPAPFPTLVDTGQENAMMLGGALYTRNIFAFFIIVAFIALYKGGKIRDNLMVFSVICSYLFVLASSGFALSERFHLPLLPFLLVFSAFGISQMNHSNKKYFFQYLLLISIIIIGWNWFKIAGRS